MTTEVTLPIKCSTVKKVKGALPTIFFWSLLVLLTIAIVYTAVLSMDALWQRTLACFMLLVVGSVILWLACPYKFKCIQD